MDATVYNEMKRFASEFVIQIFSFYNFALHFIVMFIHLQNYTLNIFFSHWTNKKKKNIYIYIYIYIEREKEREREREREKVDIFDRSDKMMKN